MNLFCYGLSHETAPVELRERFAVGGEYVHELLENVGSSLGGPEAVLLSTCNRMELYLATVGEGESVREVLRDFMERRFQPEGAWHEKMYFHTGEDCVRHLFEVAAGLKSMVLGETEIFGQTKAAYKRSFEQGVTGKYLNRMFQLAFSAAKDARTNTSITRKPVSVGSVSVELAERIFGELETTGTLVLGAGDTSEKVARSLKGKGAKEITFANRTFAKAEELAESMGGKAVSWDAWPECLLRADIVISSTAAPYYVIRRDQLERVIVQRDYRPLFLIDLAVPRDVDPGVSGLDSVYLYDIDDLQSMARRHLKERELEVEHCRAMLKGHEEKFFEWLGKQKRIEEERRMPSGSGDEERLGT